MLKYAFIFLITGTAFITKAQLTCEQLNDKNKAITAQISLYEQGPATAGGFAQFKTAYRAFRDFTSNAAAVEKDYDIKLLLQVFAIQASTHYILALRREKRFTEAWDEAVFTYTNALLQSNYQQLGNRKDNWVGCSMATQKFEIYENNYKAICTDFIGFACNAAMEVNKMQAATQLFAVTGFKGLLTENAAIRRAASAILLQRLNNGVTDDTTYLAAYKYLESYNTTHSMSDVNDDFNNLTFSKAFKIVTDPVLVERTGIAQLNNIDQFKDIWNRYGCLYATLVHDTGFVFRETFDILKISVLHYLQMLNSGKIKDYAFFPYLNCVYQTLDDVYKNGNGYSVTRPMQDILNSGDTELLIGMAAMYEILAKHCIGTYPNIEKAHHYYSAYLCYRALGDNKKAGKAFGKIPGTMLATKRADGYKKME